LKGVNIMTKHSQEFNQLVNPVKLADDTIFALSSIERGSKVSPELLRGGIELCDYLITLLEELKPPEKPLSQLTFRTVRDDKKVLQESGIDIKRVQKVKEWINDLMEDPFSRTLEDLISMQEFLMTTTMPMWQNRTLEFREKKLKRGLIIHG